MNKFNVKQIAELEALVRRDICDMTEMHEEFTLLDILARYITGAVTSLNESLGLSLDLEDLYFETHHASIQATNIILHGDYIPENEQLDKLNREIMKRLLIILVNRFFSLDKGDTVRTSGAIDELLQINASTPHSYDSMDSSDASEINNITVASPLRLVASNTSRETENEKETN